MLQQPTADDYVLATGESHSVREFVELAFGQVGRRLVWQGEGVDERGLDAASGDTLVRVDPRYYRPTAGGQSRASTPEGRGCHESVDKPHRR